MKRNLRESASTIEVAISKCLCGGKLFPSELEEIRHMTQADLMSEHGLDSLLAEKVLTHLRLEKLRHNAQSLQTYQVDSRKNYTHPRPKASPTNKIRESLGFKDEHQSYKESEFTPAQLSVLKNVFDKQFDKINMNSPEISKAVYSLNKDGYINFDTGEITDPGRIILSDIYGGKYDFLRYLGGGLNEKFSKKASPTNPIRESLDFEVEDIMSMDTGMHHDEHDQGRMLDYGHVKSDSHEGRMMRQALYELSEYSGKLYDMLNDDDDLPQWCHYKVAVARTYIGKVRHYLEYKIKHPKKK